MNNDSKRPGLKAGSMPAQLAVLLAAFLISTLQSAEARADSPRLAEGALVGAAPVDEGRGSRAGIQGLEAALLRVLSRQQAEAFASHADPAAIVLSNGEDLANFIERLEATLGALREIEAAAKGQTTFQGSIIIESPSDPDKVLFVGDNGNYSFLSSWDWASSSFKNLSLNGSNVGINTISPTRTLDVVGDIGALNRFRVFYPTTAVYDDANSNSPYSRVDADSFHTNGLGVGQLFIEGRAIDSNSLIHIGAGVAGGQGPRDVKIGDDNEVFVDTSTSRVGIGTTVPDEKLEVLGNIKLSGSIVSDGDICIGSGC